MTTEEKILKVALELFSKHGYVGTSTKRIAEAAKVNEVTIFRKFKTKSNLFQEVITWYAKEGNIIEKLKKEVTGDIHKDIYIFGISFYYFLKNNELLYKLQVKQVDEKTMKFTNSLKYRDFFANYLKEKKDLGVFIGSPREEAATFLSMIMGIFTFEMFTVDFVRDIDIPKVIEKESKRFLNDFLE